MLVTVSVALGVSYLGGSWSSGVEYEGVKYARLICAINVAWVVASCLLRYRSSTAEPSLVRNLAFHWVLFALLAWYAFPYLGEQI